MQRVKEKAIQLLQDQIVDRVIGWRAGEFFYDLTPSVFTSVEDIEKKFRLERLLRRESVQISHRGIP